MGTVFRASTNILAISGPSDLTIDVYIYDGNNIWNGYYFAAYSLQAWEDFAITAEEQTPSGFYEAIFPNLIPAGYYFVVFKQRAGENPSPTDLTVYQGPICWTGSSLQSTGTVLSG